MQEIARQIGSNLGQLTREFELITHNIANAQTAGFKRRTNAFTAALEAQKDRAAGHPSGLVDLHESLDFSQGNLIRTERPLDVALNGPGFFVVEDTNQQLYTRVGHFSTNRNGQLTDTEGRLVSGTGGPITIPPGTELSKVNIMTDGTVAAEKQTLGRIRVVDFGSANEKQLIAMGDSTYGCPEGLTPETAAKPQIVQGAQENSNVQTVEELVAMINVTRLYESHIKFITARQDASKSLMNVAMG